MSYAAKRPSMTKAKRARIFLAHDGICWLCKLRISAVEAYDIDHQISRELGGSDDDDNLAPAHKDCHRKKTKEDVRLIAKGNRLIRNADPETRRQTKHPIRSNRKLQSRPFPQRVKP